MTPQKLKKWLTVIAVVYLVFPRDLLPDYFGRGLGFIDDLLLIGFLRHFYVRRLRAFAAQAAGAEAAQDQPGRSHPVTPEASLDPYTTLGLAAPASQEAIRSAYRARMSEYHPDKVAHLGEDLQKLAHQKVLEIQQAYQQLRR